jgi:hypothetical protein
MADNLSTFRHRDRFRVGAQTTWRADLHITARVSALSDVGNAVMLCSRAHEAGHGPAA